MGQKADIPKALISGRIGLVRSLGRQGIPIILAREGRFVPERFSRYCQEFLTLPNIEAEPGETVELLECCGRNQQRKPVVFLNGETDVLLFSEQRERLRRYYEIVLADHQLLQNLIHKGRFARMAEECNLPSPRTIIPTSNDEALAAAQELGYPCVLKPIQQRRWHRPEIVAAVGAHKALLVRNREHLRYLLDCLPPLDGHDMIQEYVPGDDDHHYDFHAYFDRRGRCRGSLVGHKIRTYPVHFGQGCYTEFADVPAVTNLCIESLSRIGYVGAANINLKRHAETGRYYILEVNPRFSLWTIMDAHCGVNLPLMQYHDALGWPLPATEPHGLARRWLWFGSDFKAMRAYRRAGELSVWGWLRSFFSHAGEVEFHLLAFDDPLPLVASWWLRLKWRFTWKKHQVSGLPDRYSNPSEPYSAAIPSESHRQTTKTAARERTGCDSRVS